MGQVRTAWARADRAIELVGLWLLLVLMSVLSPAAFAARDRLVQGQSLGQGDALWSAAGRYELTLDTTGHMTLYDWAYSTALLTTKNASPAVTAVMRANGNFALFDAGNVAVWASSWFPPFSFGGQSVVLQDDGNLVIYDGNQAATWRSDTTHQPPAPTNPLRSPQGLTAGASITSPNGRYQLVMQDDGNLVFYDLGVSPKYPIMASGTYVGGPNNKSGDPGAVALLQHNGNLVVYNHLGGALWTSRSKGLCGSTLTAQDDGHLVMTSDTGTQVWTEAGPLGSGCSANALPAMPSFYKSVFTQRLPALPKLANGDGRTGLLDIYEQHGMGLATTLGTSTAIDELPSGYNADTPVYWATDSDPVYTIHCVGYDPHHVTQGNECPSMEGQQIHIPANAKWGSYPKVNCTSPPDQYFSCLIDGGSSKIDAHMTVISPDRKTEYDFWRASEFGKHDSVFYVVSGEAFPITQYNEFGMSGWQGSATAADRALTGGLMMPADFSSGVMAHALSMAVPCVNGQSVFPAKAGSGSSCPFSTAPVPPGTQPLGLSEGARLYLDMSDGDIAAMNARPAKKILYTALAHYGAFVTDTTGVFKPDPQTTGPVWYIGGGPNLFTWTDRGWSDIWNGTAYTDPWLELYTKLGGQQSGFDYRRYTELAYYSLGLDPGDVNDATVLKNMRVVDPCVTEQTC